MWSGQIRVSQQAFGTKAGALRYVWRKAKVCREAAWVTADEEEEESCASAYIHPFRDFSVLSCHIKNPNFTQEDSTNLGKTSMNLLNQLEV